MRGTHDPNQRQPVFACCTKQTRDSTINITVSTASSRLFTVLAVSCFSGSNCVDISALLFKCPEPSAEVSRPDPRSEVSEPYGRNVLMPKCLGTKCLSAIAPLKGYTWKNNIREITKTYITTFQLTYSLSFSVSFWPNQEDYNRPEAASLAYI